MQERALNCGIDLAASSVYSDSINDLPLLASMGNPVVANANKAPRSIAEKNGWGIMEGES